MATVKIVSLAIRTLAKPISSKLKQQAAEHERFRNICISIAQRLHRSEITMRVNLLGEGGSSGSGKPHIRQLSESKAIATGANFISESFLFAVAVTLIMAESYRGYRKESKRRDGVAERIENLEEALSGMQEQHRSLLDQLQKDHQQNQSVLKILDGVVDIGMKGGEMRRILAHDPQIALALEKMQREAAADSDQLANGSHRGQQADSDTSTNASADQPGQPARSVIEDKDKDPST